MGNLEIRIDAHQHFWQFDPVRDSWITGEMSVIQRDMMPGDLEPLLKQYNFDGCILVQTNQSPAENDFLLEQASAHDFIKGVVGWVDLKTADIDEQLVNCKSLKKLKGFRHILQGEVDRAYMLDASFMQGIGLLEKYNYTYDILIYPDQLEHTLEFVKAFPNQKFVVDHIAKPNIKDKKIDDWANGIKAIAGHENVYCKVSGMLTEADWLNRQEADFEPYLEVVFDAFGTGRLMFGSDWPVCNVAGGYGRVISVAEKYVNKLSAYEQSRFWGLNAAEFYTI
ncbi:MAG: amidohydrolase family protein [Mucilaginibacter sp.]